MGDKARYIPPGALEGTVASATGVASALSGSQRITAGVTNPIAGTTAMTRIVLPGPSAARTSGTEARSGGGPTLLECLTHRLRGHYEGDRDRYRDALSAEDRQRIDPIQRLRADGFANGWFTDHDACEAENEARRAVAEALEFARAGTEPARKLATSLTYV